MSANGDCGCGLAACGCCAGVENATPRPVDNRPGLSALTVRVGRHGDFLASMLARLSSHVLADGRRPLAALRTRDPDDPAIALLDAFAAAGDVLSFYNERIANEGYLRTALEFGSVEKLARLVGYAPDPGVAASVFVAFGIDPNTLGPVDIAKGTRVQSVPGQDELPQVFETSGPLLARAAWNRIGLRMSEPQSFTAEDNTLYLVGTDNRLKPGDALLLEFAARPRPTPVRVLEAVADAATDRTFVRFEPWVGVKVEDPQLERLLAEGALLGTPTIELVSQFIVRLQETLQSDAGSEIEALIAMVKDRLAAIGSLPQDELKAWLKAVGGRAEELRSELAGQGPTPPSPAPPQATFGERIKRLAIPPSKPPISAARLARTTSSSFDPRSPAALQVVGAAAPAVRDQLAVAVAGHNAAAPPQPVRVSAMRIRAGVFGRAFPKRTSVVRVDGSTTETRPIGEWKIIDFDPRGNRLPDTEKPDLITLDAAYDGIVPGSWIMVDMRGLDRLKTNPSLRVAPSDEVLLAKVRSVQPRIARADYGGSGDSTALFLDPRDAWIEFRTLGSGDELDDDGLISSAAATMDPQLLADREFQLIRRTSVYALPEELELAERPITEDFCVQDGRRIELDGFYEGLEPGRYVIVSGERSDIGDTEGVVASEVAMIAGVVHDVRRMPERARPDAAGAVPPGRPAAALPGDRMHSFVTFANKLNYCYRRETVVIHGNVVKATHGETRAEPLGNGDARMANAAFALKQAPLTWLPAPTARGAAPALDVFVDDIRWHRVETLVDAAPTDRAYVLRGGEGGKAEIQFGDGREGARPTTGVQNIRAGYRTGIGRPGNVRAGQISQLASRPLGLRDVVNPLPATGGADAESLGQLRRNAPLATMALERIVSVRDHGDFARTFAGIAKADARLLTDGARRLVHLTVAAEDDAPLDSTSDLVIALWRALARLGDPFSPALVAPRELRLLIVAATIRIDPDRVWEKVAAAVRSDLLQRFGFDRRDLAQGIAASALVAAIQCVPGVAHVDLDTFGGIPTMTGAAGDRAPLPPEEVEAGIAGVADKVVDWATARPARFEGGGFLAAELLILSPDVPATLILNRRD